MLKAQYFRDMLQSKKHINFFGWFSQYILCVYALFTCVAQKTQNVSWIAYKLTSYVVF